MSTAIMLGNEETAASRDLPGAPPAELDDEILRWTSYMQETFRRLPGGVPTPNSRAAAMTYAAIYDVVNSITPIGEPYLGTVPVPKECSSDSRCLATAINNAAAFTLAGSLPEPDILNYIFAAYLAEEERIGQRPHACGKAGRLAAVRMLQARQGDGTGDDTPYATGLPPGAWRPTGNGCASAVTPNFGKLKPFVMSSPSQFRPQRPGGFETYAGLLRSELYAEQFDMVKKVGRFDAEECGLRTSEQSEIAVFWSNDVGGTYHPPGQLLEHTRIISQNYELSVQENARLFGLVGLVLGDAAISSFDSKYETGIDLWRPATAIQMADADDNDATKPDPEWEPLLLNAAGTARITPCFPSYTSGHATFGGAWTTVLRCYFGTDEVSYTGTTEDPQAGGLTRSFTSLSEVAGEIASSRVFLGVHFPFDGEAARAAGEELGEYIFSTQLRPN